MSYFSLYQSVHFFLKELIRLWNLFGIPFITLFYFYFTRMCNYFLFLCSFLFDCTLSLNLPVSFLWSLPLPPPTSFKFLKCHALLLLTLSNFFYYFLFYFYHIFLDLLCFPLLIVELNNLFTFFCSKYFFIITIIWNNISTLTPSNLPLVSSLISTLIFWCYLELWFWIASGIVLSLCLTPLGPWILFCW